MWSSALASWVISTPVMPPIGERAMRFPLSTAARSTVARRTLAGLVPEPSRAAAIWRPLAETQDALAEDGLAFLRGQFH
jgi:hypothetical protein